MSNTPSKYQSNIYNWITNSTGNAIVQAVAGSGKTTTIVEASKLIPKDKKSIFVAFNKAIATELRGRLPLNVEVKTLHAFGLSLFRQNTTIQTKVDNDKIFELIRQTLIDNNYSDQEVDFSEKISVLKKLIPLIKAYYIDYTQYEPINNLMIEKGFDSELDDITFDIIKKVIDKCKTMIEKIDFDDMIWIPVVNNYKSTIYDWVFVDEQQDLNKIQFELIKKMCGPNTRVIGVGDEKQSIYAFRGADTNSMKNFKDYFDATELPLSICYRCPKTHIELAKELVPTIEAFDGNEDGLIENIGLDQSIELMQNKDLVLSRTNAPLIKIAFKLIRSNKKAIVKGRDIGKGLITLINRYKVYNLEDLENKITKYKELQEKKLDLILQDAYDKRKKNSLVQNIDSCETLLALIENVESIDELKSKIETIFSDMNEGIICSSVHKAKGLETDNTFIINYELMPHPMAKTEEELDQEMNIKYVALTRAKKTMRFIRGKV